MGVMVSDVDLLHPGKAAAVISVEEEKEEEEETEEELPVASLKPGCLLKIWRQRWVSKALLGGGFK